MTIREAMLNLLHTDVAFREEVRRQLLTEEVLALPTLGRELPVSSPTPTAPMRVTPMPL